MSGCLQAGNWRLRGMRLAQGQSACSSVRGNGIKYLKGAAETKCACDCGTRRRCHCACVSPRGTCPSACGCIYPNEVTDGKTALNSCGEECNKSGHGKGSQASLTNTPPQLQIHFSRITGRLQIFTETTKPPAMLIPQTAVSQNFSPQPGAGPNPTSLPSALVSPP